MSTIAYLRAGVASLIAGIAFTGVAVAADQVTLGTGWLPQAEFGGYYQALADGTYEKYGIELTIIPGGPQVNTSQLLAAGEFTFARIANSTEVFNLLTQDLPYVAVASIYQKDPQVLIAHSSQAITGLDAIGDRPVMMTNGSAITWWPYIRNKFGYSDEQIRPYQYGNAAFLAEETALTQGYATNDLHRMRREGYEVDDFPLSDYGYAPYSQLIVTSTALVEENPDLVQRFVNATIEGWKTYLHGDRSAADALMTEGNPDYAGQHVIDSIATIVDDEYVEGGDAKTLGIGTMSDARWEEFFKVITEAGAVPADVDYKKAYTLQFVNQGFGL